MIKDILVNLAVNSKRSATADYAVSMATSFDAHITGVAFAYEPVEVGSVFDGASASLIATFRQEGEAAANSAIAKFNDVARRNSLSAETHMLSASTGGGADMFARMARAHDLSVVGQTEPDGSPAEDLILEAALFNSGRPVLVVPYIQKDALKLDRILLCWDGSRNAARACADALPLLRRAKLIDVVTIAASDRPNELPGADIAHHLARHGVKVELKRIVAPGTDVANTILSYAADSSADFVVMGGYGHSRLREFVLGGATRGMLSAMTVPTLMSH
jgi:nucleotide-binding universal stress UspA family protein